MYIVLYLGHLIYLESQSWEGHDTWIDHMLAIPVNDMWAVLEKWVGIRVG